MAISGDSVSLTGYDVTAAEAEAAILDYLRDCRGEPISFWPMLNKLATHENRTEKRKERLFYLNQLTRLVREGKVIQYYRDTNMKRGRLTASQKLRRVHLGWRAKVRISEAYA